jgi:uncharacterized protein (UPF0332 family)
MRWDEFLNTAERLALGATEADWRSAVSRAYYGLFHYLREVLLAGGLNLGAGGACHFNLYAGLMNCGIAAAARLAPRLDRLREARVKADYNMNRLVSRSIAQQEVQEARSLAADFQSVLSTVPPAHLAAGVRRYLKAMRRIP